MEKFRRLGINAAMLRSIQEEGFEDPTPIQIKSIPHILSDRDVIAGAATGSGKTLAFGAAIVDKCKKGNGIQAFVLTPTRELTIQVARALKIHSKYNPLVIVKVYGGVSINPQITRLKIADVVVGTPGRVLDHLRRGTMKLNNLKILVLDEADRMLDMGFMPDVDAIINHCPKKRQTLLFSATITPDVVHLSRRYMKNQVKISAEPFVDPSKLAQVYYNVPANLKFSLLLHLLRQEHDGLAMVFCNTRINVDFVVRNLRGKGIKAIAIHGGFSQAKRERTIKSFHAQHVPALVCTDVAARGLDIQGVTHIYNYDIPKESKQYIHRIGRTARAGEKGKAISLLSNRDYDNFSRVLRDFPVQVVEEKRPRVERVRLNWIERPRHRGYKGKTMHHRHRRSGTGSSGSHGFSRKRFS